MQVEYSTVKAMRGQDRIVKVVKEYALVILQTKERVSLLIVLHTQHRQVKKNIGEAKDRDQGQEGIFQEGKRTPEGIPKSNSNQFNQTVCRCANSS